MIEITVNVEGFSPHNLKKVQDGFYALGCKWQAGSDEYFNFDGLNPKYLTNKEMFGATGTHIFWSNDNCEATHTFDELMQLGFTSKNSDELRTLLDEYRGEIGQLQAKSLAIVQLLHKRKLKPI